MVEITSTALPIPIARGSAMWRYEMRKSAGVPWIAAARTVQRIARRRQTAKDKRVRMKVIKAIRRGITYQ